MSGLNDSAVQQKQALAAFGLQATIETQNNFFLWPDNERVMQVFGCLLTEWNMGPSGPIGLKIESIVCVLRLLDVPRVAWSTVIADLRHAEAEALKIFYEAANDK